MMGGDGINKRQKEVFQYQLDQEDKVLKDLKRQYERALRDINDRIKLLQSDELTQSRIYQINYQKTLKAQVEAILDKLRADQYNTIQKYLNDGYRDAFIGNMYDMQGQGIPVITPIDKNAAVKAVITNSELSTDLYAALGYDMDILKKHIRQEITRGIATSLPYEQIARNISNFTTLPFSNAKRITRTECHRIQQESAEDSRKAAKAKGADVVKMWDSVTDGDTRPLHRQLDGQIREVDEPFEAGGKKVMYPGKFGDPAQDCNCRCVALTRARWALDEKELETLKERAKYFGLDKTKDFEDYKKKYLKAAKTVENTEKSGIIKVPKFRTTDDPMREVTGPGLVSNPKEIASIIDDLEQAGAEIVYKTTEMAYSPRTGKPGQFIINKDASYSAWMHEYQHFCDDRDDGYPGMRILMDREKCKQREIRAYQVEIELAKKANRPDIVERLEALMKKEVSRYDEYTEDD